MRIISASLLLFILPSCSRPSPTITPWREMLGLRSECSAAPLGAPSSWVRWPVASPAGELRLPPSFRSAGGATGQTLWLGSDSSEVAYVVSPEPSSAMAGQSPLLSRLRRPSYRLERACRMGVGGHEASMDTFQQVDSAKTDTVFGLAASVAISERQFAEVLVLTPKAAMRDSVLGAVASLRWP